VKHIAIAALLAGCVAFPMAGSVQAQPGHEGHNHPPATPPASAKPKETLSGPKSGVRQPAPKNEATTAALTPTPAAAGVDSLPILEKVVARDSSRFDALYRLGILYLDRDRIPEAMRVLARANQLEPRNVGVLVNLGAAEDAQGRSAEAQRYYRQALELSPEDSIATCRLASSLYAQSKYGESVDLLRSLITSKPNSHCAYFTLGVAFADAGIYRDAIRMWRKVVELAPRSPEAASATESIDVLEKFIRTQ
jgi:Flp pilus assembly protein TadD